MMYILYLNDMRASNIEMQKGVARAETREELLALLERERVEPYVDVGDRVVVHTTDAIASAAGGPVHEPVPAYRWHKTFRKGGPLEWFNPPWRHVDPIEVVPGLEEHLEKARRRWYEVVGAVPDVASL